MAKPGHGQGGPTNALIADSDPERKTTNAFTNLGQSEAGVPGHGQVWPGQTAHALYRFYGDDGQLLYVGLTMNPSQRFTAHRDTQPWWQEVRGISIEQYDDRESVAAAERRAIAVESPRYNIQRPRLKPKVSKRSGPIFTLVWSCAKCGRPVTDGTGYIHLDMQKIDSYEESEREWKLRNPGPVIRMDAYMSYPDLVRWKVHHRTCDPDPDAPDYAIDVERCRTHADLLAWTGHLMRKKWIGCSDWDRLVKRTAKVNP